MVDQQTTEVVRTSAAPAAAELERAFQHFAHHQIAGVRQLQELVLAYGDEMKRAGWPVERIIISIKEIAGRAGYRARSVGYLTPKAAPAVAGNELYTDSDPLELSVRWCIERYYEASSVPAPARRRN